MCRRMCCCCAVTPAPCWWMRGSGRYAAGWPGGSDDLAAALAGAGCAPEQIELVVLTHLDFDHCGGCLQLPQSRVAVPAGAQPADGCGQEVIAQLESEGRVDRIQDGGEAAPGVVLRAAPGHRAGHSLAEIGGSLVHLADLVHHRLHVQHPQWDRRFDSDVEVALATRLRVLDELARSGLIVTASHIAGAGRIVPAAGGGQRWQDA